MPPPICQPQAHRRAAKAHAILLAALYCCRLDAERHDSASSSFVPHSLISPIGAPRIDFARHMAPGFTAALCLRRSSRLFPVELPISSACYRETKSRRCEAWRTATPLLREDMIDLLISFLSISPSPVMVVLFLTSRPEFYHLCF